MSYNFSKLYDTHEQAVAEATADMTASSVPDTIQQYVIAGISSLANTEQGKKVFVSAFGHLHTGEAGNYTTTNASVEVAPKE